LGGREKRLALGVHPAVNLAEARERAEAARRQLRDGIDPMTERKRAKDGAATPSSRRFGTAAAESLDRQKGGSRRQPMPRPTRVSRNKVRAACLGERRKMMQTWADYLDGLRGGAPVVPIRAKQGCCQVEKPGTCTGSPPPKPRKIGSKRRSNDSLSRIDGSSGSPRLSPISGRLPA
jgi:hypothetical protein